VLAHGRAVHKSVAVAGSYAATKQREDVEQSERLRAAVCIVLEFWLMDAVCPYVQSLSFAQ
jgi:hypothetical protein